MADRQVITILLRVPTDEANAFAELLKRTTYDDCLRHSNRLRRYPDGRQEVDVMWAAVKLVENQFRTPAWRRADFAGVFVTARTPVCFP